VLSVVALPRLSSVAPAYDDLRFFDETVAALRFARSSATAMQRTVCVTFNPNHKQLSLTYDSAYVPAGCGPTLAPPGGSGAAYVVNAQGASVYSGEASFNFDRVGRPSAAQTIAVGSRQIIVESETGYVR